MAMRHCAGIFGYNRSGNSPVLAQYYQVEQVSKNQQKLRLWPGEGRGECAVPLGTRDVAG